MLSSSRSLGIDEFPGKEALSPDPSPQTGNGYRGNTDIPFLPLASRDCASPCRRLHTSSNCLHRYDDLAAQFGTAEEFFLGHIRIQTYDAGDRGRSTPKPCPNGLGSVDPQHWLDYPWLTHPCVGLVQWFDCSTRLKFAGPNFAEVCERASETTVPTWPA
jgi:hypothetical protein